MSECHQQKVWIGATSYQGSSDINQPKCGESHGKESDENERLNLDEKCGESHGKESDENEILNLDEKFKASMIKLFQDNYED